jgi:hypothetical protein
MPQSGKVDLVPRVCHTQKVQDPNRRSCRQRFENKNIFSWFVKRCSLIQRWRCTYVVVNSKVVGLATSFCDFFTRGIIKLVPFYTYVRCKYFLGKCKTHWLSPYIQILSILIYIILIYTINTWLSFGLAIEPNHFLTVPEDKSATSNCPSGNGGQCDQMRLWKYRPKSSPTHFCKTYRTFPW